MDERDTRVERRGMRDGGEVVRLLDRRGAEHREPCGPARHDVGVIAENGQGVGGDGARRDSMVKGVNSPAILNIDGIISSSPCDAVKVVDNAPACSAPCTAPAAPASDCISTTAGISPQRFRRP
jgi:hypothetical protein